jgi:hypothetical protein
MHGKHVLGIVVAQGRLFQKSVPKILIINYMVGPYQAGQIKGLGGRVHGDGAVLGVL